MQNPFLIGEKVYLRPIEMEDLESNVKWINDPEGRKFLSRVHPINKLQEEKFIKKLYEEGSNSVVLAIMEKEEDFYIGNIGLHNIDKIHRKATLGIIIGQKKYWGRGYGTEAIRLMLDYGFNQLNLHRIIGKAFTENKRSIRAQKKAGLREEGILRRDIFRLGKYHDVVILAILEEEYREMTKK